MPISVLFDAFLATSILFRNRQALVTSLVQTVHNFNIHNVGGGRGSNCVGTERGPQSTQRDGPDRMLKVR